MNVRHPGCTGSRWNTVWFASTLNGYINKARMIYIMTRMDTWHCEQILRPCVEDTLTSRNYEKDCMGVRMICWPMHSAHGSWIRAAGSIKKEQLHTCELEAASVQR